MRERAIPLSPTANFITGRDVRYYSSTGEDITELRRAQLRFGDVRREEAGRNAWMAIPALAPAAAVFGIEAGAAAAARLAPRFLKPVPVAPPPRINGNTEAAVWGQRAHGYYDRVVENKPGWDNRYWFRDENGRLLRPDIAAPARNPQQPDKRYLMELKPDTLSGRRAGIKSKEKYETNNKTRIIYYNPDDFK